MFILIAIGIATMGSVIYMAISRKSSFKVRIAALSALALMIVTVIICIILSFKATAVPKQFILPDALPSEIPPVEANSPFPVIIFIIFLIALFVAILIMSLREQKRAEGKIEPSVNDW